MLTQFMAAAGVLAMLTVVPGPDLAVVTQRAVVSGPADGLRTVGGIAAGLLIWGVLTIAGLAAVLAASTDAYRAVKLLGSAYLVLLGAQALWQNRRGAPPAAGSGGGHTTGNPWRAGLISNVLNPKIAVFYTGLLPALVPAGLPTVAAMMILVLIHSALSLAWLGSYVFVLARAKPVFERPHVRRALGRTTGVVLIGFGIAVAAASG
ncbi:LysE family translocator [Streptomyces sp. NPDC001530]|uniref:LysE family translocator n=1 Tax=Streptomyces sp. NPDC001530 TaxID=3364582 RepID=UPI0036A05403